MKNRDQEVSISVLRKEVQWSTCKALVTIQKAQQEQEQEQEQNAPLQLGRQSAYLCGNS
jgi:hypothetical protein